MITRRHLSLSAAAAVTLAACGKASTTAIPGTLTFSVPPTTATDATRANWRPVLDDMAAATGLAVTLLISPSGAALVEAMRRRQTDAGWFSNRLGLEAVRRAHGEVFARTLGPDGISGYESLLIANARRGVTLDKIRKCDRSLSYGQADPASTAGYAAPIAYFFGPNDLRPQKCFASVRTGEAGANLAAVASGALDVAAVSSETLALAGEAGQREADEVKILWTSPTLPEDPIIWRKDLDPAVKEKLRQFFITYARGDGAEAARQRANLRPLGVGGFEPADDNHLLIIREIEAGEALALAKWSDDRARVAEAQRALDRVKAELQAFEGRISAQAGTQ